MVAASATLNYRYTFGMFGNGAVESYAYAIGAVCLEIMKALAPLLIALRLRSRDRLAIVGAALIVPVGIAWSFMCAMGLAAQNRADRAVPVENLLAQFKAAKDELARIERQLAKAGEARPVRVIEADIDAALKRTLRVGKQAKTVAELTEDCAKPTRATARACEGVAALRRELAIAQELHALDQQASLARAMIAKLRDAGAGEARLADAQAHFVARWLSDIRGLAVSIGAVQFGLAILLAAAFEAVTAFGLALSLGRHGVPQPPADPPSAAQPDETAAAVATFCRTQLKPAPGTKLSFRRAFEGYAAWCKAERLPALPKEAFMAALRKAAQAQGLSVAGGIIHNVTL